MWDSIKMHNSVSDEPDLIIPVWFQSLLEPERMQFLKNKPEHRTYFEHNGVKALK